MKTVIDFNGNKCDVESFRKSLQTFPSYCRKDMSQNGEAFLSDCVFVKSECGCQIIGNGTLQFPLQIKHCFKHSV